MFSAAGGCLLAQSQSAATAEIEAPVIASGGGETSGGGAVVSATIGQPVSPSDTVAGADEETVWIGFWSVIPSDPASVREERLSGGASGTRIAALAPNPFTDRLAIDVELARGARVVLAVHDLLGREVARLIDGAREPGAHRVTWRPENLPEGAYIIRLDVDGVTRASSAIQHYR